MTYAVPRAACVRFTLLGSVSLLHGSVRSCFAAACFVDNGTYLSTGVFHERKNSTGSCVLQAHNSCPVLYYVSKLFAALLDLFSHPTPVFLLAPPLPLCLPLPLPDVAASIVPSGRLRRDRALSRQAEPRLCVFAAERVGAQLDDLQHRLNGEDDLAGRAARADRLRAGATLDRAGTRIRQRARRSQPTTSLTSSPSAGPRSARIPPCGMSGE